MLMAEKTLLALTDPERQYAWSDGRAGIVYKMGLLKDAFEDLRTRFLSAKRFVIDPELWVEIADLMSTSVGVREFFGAAHLARLPFEKIFLEWNPGVTADALRRVGICREPRIAGESIKIVGVLVERLNPEGTAWHALPIQLMYGKAYIAGCGFAVGTDGSDPRPYLRHLDAAPFPFDEIVAPPSSHGWGTGLANGNTMFPIGDVGLLVANCVTITPFATKIVDGIERFRGEEGRLDMLKGLNKIVHCDRGMTMKVICALAVLNTSPVPPQECVRGRRTYGSRLLPAMSYSVLKIEKGRPEYVSSVSSIVEEGVRRREHDVRGHFRRYRNEDGTVRKEIWIDEHKRGDPDLGRVVHDYELSVRRNL
jgi:hypothetical protein